ncbi:MAG: helix-turn-helix domain-containing protein [Oscillospiraceae bacterium]|nr:helix-turn-helix domain-containing protein [Oscillospiraceae bacterium]
MDISTKIRLAVAYRGITETELARRLSMSPQAFGQRLKTGKFSSADLDRIAAALGAKYECYYEFEDGQKI